PLGSPAVTTYSWAEDRKLQSISRPDGTTIELAYDGGGRPATITTDAGISRYAYADNTDRISSIAAPGGQTLHYAYDGLVLSREAWSGPVSGNVGIRYDSNLRVIERTVNEADPIAYSYDSDGLLTQSGDLTVIRDPSNGRITRSLAGAVIT